MVSGARLQFGKFFFRWNVDGQHRQPTLSKRKWPALFVLKWRGRILGGLFCTATVRRRMLLKRGPDLPDQ